MGKRTDDQLFELPEIKPSKKLPILSKIQESDPATMTLADALAEAHTLRTAEARLKAVKLRVLELMNAKDQNGVRCGRLCAITRFQSGRRSFDRALAVEAGITPDQIEASMKEGPGFWVVELPEIVGE